MYSDITHSYSDFCIFVRLLNKRFYICTMSFVCTVVLCGLTTGWWLILNAMCIGWGNGGLVRHPSLWVADWSSFSYGTPPPLQRGMPSCLHVWSTSWGEKKMWKKWAKCRVVLNIHFPLFWTDKSLASHRVVLSLDKMYGSLKRSPVWHKRRITHPFRFFSPHLEG